MKSVERRGIIQEIHTAKSIRNVYSLSEKNYHFFNKQFFYATAYRTNWKYPPSKVSRGRTGRFFATTNKWEVLQSIKENLRTDQRVFIGVIDVMNPRVESPEEICDTILEAAEILPVEQLGTTDDCGFSPFADDLSTSRDTAFAKITSRVQGTKMASEKLS